MKLIDLDATATARHGLVTMADSGLSRDTWYRALRSGTLEQLHPGVARLIGTPSSQRQRIAAAVLAFDPGAFAAVGDEPSRVTRRGGAVEALASHRSAAWLWLNRAHEERLGQSASERLVDVTITDRRRRRSLDSVVVHRPTDDRRLTPQRVDGIRCTNILRTLLDLGAVAPTEVHGLLGHALSSKLASLDAVESALLQHARPGRSGVTALRRAVDDWAIDTKPADSVLELAFAHLVKRFALPVVEFHPIVEGWEVDFRFVGTRLLVECDGWTSHGLDRTQFERDRRRDAELVAAGWVVSRHTYRAITREAAATARRLRHLLSAVG